MAACPTKYLLGISVRRAGMLGLIEVGARITHTVEIDHLFMYMMCSGTGEAILLWNITKHGLTDHLTLGGYVMTLAPKCFELLLAFCGLPPVNFDRL